MKSAAEVKFTGDGYAGFYSCGLTMQDSNTFRDFKETVSTDDKTEYVNSQNVKLSVSHKVNEFDATEIQTVIENRSDKEFTMEMLTSFKLPGIAADKVYRFTSFWSAEGKVKADKLTDLNLERSWNHMAFRVEKFGNVGSMPVRRYFPFVALEDSKTHTFTAVSLYSPSSWQIEISVRHDDTVTLLGGIADRDFGHWSATVKPGESFSAPRAVAATGKTLEEACDKLVKSQRPDISKVDDHMGAVFNEYCATWGNPTYDNLVKVADKLEGKGIQYLVMDSGWYGENGFKGYWFENTGDWRVNEAKFPGGLKPIASYIRSKGMIPGIWFEFEVVTPKCELYNHPEHLLKKDGVPLTIGDRRYLDMEDPWVIEHLKKYVIGTLKEAGYGYIKVDYNDTLGIGVDGPFDIGENLRRKVLATQKFFKLMKEEIPELVIENCSSGGHRLEGSFMELSSQASFSDAHEIVSLPLIAANLHRITKPSQTQIWAVMRKDDSDYRIYYSLCATMLGRMGLSGDIYDLSDHQWQLFSQSMDFYKKASRIIEKGTTTVICADTESYNDPTGCQVVIREFEGKGLLVFHRFKDSTDLSGFCRNMKIKLPLLKNQIAYGDASVDFSAQSILFDL